MDPAATSDTSSDLKVKTMQKYDVIVIGSGPAGKTAAIQAAKLGRKVVVIDSMSEVGGVCVHTGTIPAKPCARPCSI